jgi:hypothetical protein
MADCKASSESTLSKVHISPPFWPFFLSICHQSSDIVVPDQTEFHSDIERASGSTALIPVDPYQIRDGILTEEELAGLRRRRKGKAVAKYQSRQNNVRDNREPNSTA